jgi:uncharacterized DUF497 family protein
MEPFWDGPSRDHIAKHGVTSEEVNYVLAHSHSPFPEEIGEGKYWVRGQTQAGRFLQVIFVYRRIETLDWQVLDWEDRLVLLEEEADEVVYVIHARELTDREKRALRRR